MNDDLQIDRWEVMMRLADIHEALSARHLSAAMWGLERLIIELAQEHAMEVRAHSIEGGLPEHMFNN